MANVNTKAHVLVRDGFACQFCGQLVFLSQGVKVLDMHVPGLELWDLHGKIEPLRTRWATVDHLVPEVEGGMDTLDNLAACCVACNSRKGGTSAPAPPRPEAKGNWDGLSGLFLGLADRYADRLSKEDQKWRRALEREGVQPRLDPLDAVLAALQGMKRGDVADVDATLHAAAASPPRVLGGVNRGNPGDVT